MALGDIIDMHDVKPGIDVGGHPSRGGVADHLAGRGRLDVARSDRGGGVDHDHRQPVSPGEVQHGFFGQILGPLVDADEIGLDGGRGLIRRCAVADLSEGGDGAAMNDAFGAGAGGGAHHRQGTIDVGAQHGVRVGHPEAIVGGDVQDIAAAGGGAVEGGWIG